MAGAGNPPAAGVGEFFADELAMVLNCSRAEATVQAELCTTLVRHLPVTWAALADEGLGWPRARAVAAELAGPVRELAPQAVGAIEAAVLPAARELAVTRLRAAVRREVLRHDAAAAERRRAQAERCADVVVRPAPDGMAELSVFAPQPLAAAIRETIDRYARLAKADDPARPIGQLRVAALADLVLRPWDTSRPAVTAHLDVLAPVGALFAAAGGHDACAVGHQLPHPPHTAPTPGDPAGSGQPPRPGDPPAPGGPSWSAAPGESGDPPGCGAVDPADSGPSAAPGCTAPAEVNGQPITTGQLRELLQFLDALCPGGLQAPTGGTLGIALLDPATGAQRATATRNELQRLVRRGCPTHPDTDTDTGCDCPVLGPPAPTDRYRPAAAQHRFTTTRDRGCRHPGCTNHAGWADLDHVLPHADGGATSCQNLCCLCRRHHRLKTFAPGWRFTMTPDGVLTVTTPSGVTRTTRPPGMAATGPPPPEAPPPAWPPDRRPTGHPSAPAPPPAPAQPPPSVEHSHDPAPF
ncbi:MAG: HNH endonuclease [Arsenicicoccus sp.]|nr:MAG: HNH endonuclease [Arsenicicoccus sp.]